MQNIYNFMPGTEGEKFRSVLSHISRVYPGPNVIPIKANRPNSREYAQKDNETLCECDDCAA